MAKKKAFKKTRDMLFDEYTWSLMQIKEATSVTGIRYININSEGVNITGIRESTSNPFSINSLKLYQALCELDIFTTSSLKPYVDRVQSPSLAILKELGVLEEVEIDVNEDGVEQIPQAKKSDLFVTKKESSFMSPTIKKFIIGAGIGCILVFLGMLGEDKPVENGKLTDAAQKEAVVAIKSQLDNPSSYEGGSWRSAVWDSSSFSQHYVLMQQFTYKNGFGERVRGIAYVYFDENGKPTSIEFQ